MVYFDQDGNATQTIFDDYGFLKQGVHEEILQIIADVALPTCDAVAAYYAVSAYNVSGCAGCHSDYYIN